MSHVDEGALHAYLDGALDEYPAAEARRVREHVETCSVCSGRLLKERRVREDAQTILGLAAPDVDVPTFEELRAYVRRSQPGRTRATVRLHRLGWVASVVLALGTGWVLRGGRAVPTAPLDAVRAPSTPGAGAAPEQSAGVSEGGEPVEARPQEDAAGGRAAALEQSASAPSAPTGEPAADVTAAAGARPDDATETTALAQVGGSGAVATRAPEASGVATTAVPTTLAPVLARVRALGLGDVVAQGGLEPPEPAPLAAELADSLAETEEAKVAGRQAVERPDTVARQAEPERRAPPDQRTASSIAARPTPASALRSRAERDEDISDDEEVSLVVPGLDVIDVLPVGQGSTFLGMRALQRLESGDTLELIHLPEGLDPSASPPLAEGWSELVVQRGGGWLVLRAPVPAVALQELLQRLDDGR